MLRFLSSSSSSSPSSFSPLSRIMRSSPNLFSSAFSSSAASSCHLVKNIGALVTPSASGASIETHRDCALRIEQGKVVAILSSSAASSSSSSSSSSGVVDAGGGLVTPGFIDAHTHLMPPRDRANEFAMRSVKSYKEIAAEGGGILSTVKSIRESSVEDIVIANRPYMAQFFAQGTTTVEVKSGYGLTTKDEIKTLEAIAQLQEEFKDKLTIVPTFMGAHAVPVEYKQNPQAYVDLVCNEMIPAVAAKGLATFCDVFCENGYFDATSTEQILKAAKKHGMKLRIHADEFVDSGGAELASRMGAFSADHLMAVSDKGIQAMATAGVIPIVLPGATVFLGKGHGYAPMRKLLDGGCRLAVATDSNPGSSVHQSIPQMMQLCMANGGITLDEALLAATQNAAASLDLEGTVGTLQPKASADLIIWSMEDASQIPYFGCESRHRISGVMKNGHYFDSPTAGLTSFHRQAFEHRRAASMSKRGYHTTARQFSTVPDEKEDEVMGVLNVSNPCSVQNVVHSITDYVTVDPELGQIVELPKGVDLKQYVAGGEMPLLDRSCPHAPERLTRLVGEEEHELAIKNSLKYFHESLHEQLRPVAEYELEKYGHIYFYPLLPPDHVWAIPFEDIPGQTVEARAMTHMILNVLDPRVAQFPQELITYGGNGAVFQNWAQFHVTMRLLARMTEKQTLSMNSGHPAGLFPRRPNQGIPAAVIANGMMIPHYSTPEQLDRLYALGVTMYGQMTAGSWMYIGPQGIVHGTTLTVAQACAMQARSTHSDDVGCAGKLFVTSGLGGMSGAQPKAATINGCVCIVAEIDANALKKRHAQGWLNEYYSSVEDVLRRAKQAQECKESISIGYIGNVVDIWESLSKTPKEHRPVVHLGSDQTSLHNPYNGGYYPVGMTFEEANEMMTHDFEGFKAAVKNSLRRQLSAIQSLRKSDNLMFFDYGNAFLLECHRAGCEVDKEIPSYVECIMGPEFFDFGFGPYRWVCTSGQPSDLQVTDALAAEVLREQLADSPECIQPQLQANLDWIEQAQANALVVGSQARILYSDLEGRVECAVRMNQAVRDGKISAPVVIGRDHHDVSGTDAPWRETANIKDGSNLTADMSVQNVIGDAMRGATWVSLHNGGGTGWGMANNGGFGLVLDGTDLAEARARDMVFFDVANGVTRRARAGNPNAIHTIRALSKKYPDFDPFFPAV